METTDCVCEFGAFIEQVDSPSVCVSHFLSGCQIPAEETSVPEACSHVPSFSETQERGQVRQGWRKQVDHFAKWLSSLLRSWYFASLMCASCMMVLRPNKPTAV